MTTLKNVAEIRPDTELFDRGAFTAHLDWLRLSGREPRRVLVRAVVAVGLTWLPIFVLAALQGLLLNDNRRESMLLDIRVHGQFLLALPLLVIAESSVLERLATNAMYFWKSGLVPPERKADFDAAFGSARRALRSPWTAVLLLLAAYGLMFVARRVMTDEPGSSWRNPTSLNGELSWAAQWVRWVSLPIFFGAFLGWVWRFGVWGKFLLTMTRLDLRMVWSDPDGRGGLGFLATSVPPCGLLGFALSTAIASGMLARIFLEGASPLAWKWVPVVLVVLVMLLCVTPLLVMYPMMLVNRRRAWLEYRALTLALGRQFQTAWLTPRAGDNPEALQASDFSATTDLFSIAANAHRMIPFPVDLASIVSLIIPTLLPFFPVLLTIVPLADLLKAVFHLLAG